MSEIISCPLCESPMNALQCSNASCLRAEFTPEQSAEYRKYLASPAGTARALVEARAEIAQLEMEMKRQQANAAEESVNFIRDLETIRKQGGAQLYAAESQIAVLKVELAAMMKERDAAIIHMETWKDDYELVAGDAKAWMERANEAEKARDAALADLSQARAEIERLRHARTMEVKP